MALGLAAAGPILAPAAAEARNLTFGEIKLGILPHDVHFLGGKERGVDINPEFIFASPVSDAWAAGVPAYVHWIVQPRPTLGAEVNTSGFTSQYYFGATWTWQLFSDVLRQDDGVTLGIFLGPSFNNGERVARRPDRKSLGSNVLFREALELGYRITPVYQISFFIDHESNAGLTRHNQSLNDVGGRIGIRF